MIQVINEGDPDPDPIILPPPVTRPMLAPTSGSQRLEIKAVSLMPLVALLALKTVIKFFLQ